MYLTNDKSSPGEDPIHLAHRVWDLYGSGRALDAADAWLRGEFDDREMEFMIQRSPVFVLAMSGRRKRRTMPCERAIEGGAGTACSTSALLCHLNV